MIGTGLQGQAWIFDMKGGGWHEMVITVRGNFKYYFVDFVRNGGTPPPFPDKIFSKEGVTDLGDTPPPPFTDFAPKFFLQKGL